MKVKRNFAHIFCTRGPLQRLDYRANTGYGSVFVFLSASVCHKSVFYRKGWTDRAGFWHGGFFRPILHRVGCNKFRYLENKGTSCWKFVLNFVLGKFRHAYRSSKRVISWHWRRQKGSRGSTPPMAGQKKLTLCLHLKDDISVTDILKISKIT